MALPADHPDKTVCIIGLGYVGLTLAVVMAEVGFRVHGVDRDERIVSAVAAGGAHFTEAGLDSRVAAQVAAGRLSAACEWPAAGAATVYIITVGTPLDAERRVDIGAINSVAGRLVGRLRAGDLVVLRSTVRIGVSRETVKPALDAAGVTYDLAFCPERTLEGRALAELRTLPQVVGGVDERSTTRASQLFNVITPTTIRVRDLETAEMIKLVNNTQRDLLFAFANEVAGMCDAVGVSAVEVIQAGSVGYPRATMIMPGPVGGPCLEKDPHILAEGVHARGGEVRLGLLGRAINEEAPATAAAAVAEALVGRTPSRLVVAGLAFKGRPETSDLRGTPARSLIAHLRGRFPQAEIAGFDPAVSAEDIGELGLTPTSTAAAAFQGADAVIFQNNNAAFERLDLGALSETMAADAVVYDLWNQFDPETLNLRSDVVYFGLGTGVLKRDRQRRAPA